MQRMNDEFDKLLKECEVKYPQEMAEARIWAKQFIEKWREDPSIVDVRKIDIEYDGSFVCDEHSYPIKCWEYCPICAEEEWV